MEKTYIIIGTSAAALGVLNKLRTLDAHARIICISDEPELPYNKCFLADYLSSQKDEAAVYTKPHHFFEQKNIQLMLGMRVVALNTRTKTITLHDERVIHYDTLFLGTGSSPLIPFSLQSIHALQGVFTFHTLADTNAVLQYAQTHIVKRALIVGTGLSGLEAADSLSQRDLSVTVMCRKTKLLRRFLDEQGSELVESMMKRSGIILLKNSEVHAVQRIDDALHIQLSDGTYHATDMLILATGLKPNNELAHQAGLHVQDGYLCVNQYMQTSDPSIFAAGDCCAVPEQKTGARVPSTTWPDAMMQGMIAAHAMTGQHKKHPGIRPIISSSFFNTQFIAAGVLHPEPRAYDVHCTTGTDFYHKVVMNDNRVEGFLLVGQTHYAAKLKRALLTGMPLE